MINIDGNDFDQIRAAFKEARETKGMPTANYRQDSEKEKAFPSWKMFVTGMEKLQMMSSSNVWFATQGGGLWRLDKNNAWKQYKYVENDSTSLVSDQVNCLAIGEKGQLYVATSEGLCEFLPSKVYSAESPSMRQVRISRVLLFRRE